MSAAPENDELVDVARGYVAAVNAGDAAALLALFADDIVLRHPTGTFEGHDAARGFYTDLVFAGQAQLELGRTATAERLVFFELTATSALDPNGSVVSTVDVAEVSEHGTIRALDVYYR